MKIDCKTIYSNNKFYGMFRDLVWHYKLCNIELKNKEYNDMINSNTKVLIKKWKKYFDKRNFNLIVIKS